MAARSTTSLSTSSSSTSRTAPAVDLRHRHAGEAARPIGRPVALDPHHQAPPAAGRQVVHRPDDDEAAVVDDRHLLAEILDQIELVAREEDAAAGLGLLDEHLPDGVDAGGVEAGQRFVEHQQLRVVRRGPPPAGPAAGCRARAPRPCSSCGRRSRDARARSAWPRAASGRLEAVQAPEVLDLLADEHAGVQAALLGHVAEPPALGLADRPRRSTARCPRRGRSGRRSPASSSSCRRRSGRGSRRRARRGTSKVRSSSAVRSRRCGATPRSPAGRPPVQARRGCTR